MPANLANALDIEKARRMGSIYYGGPAVGWKCPNHIIPLEREGNHLFCPKGCITVFSPPPLPLRGDDHD